MGHCAQPHPLSHSCLTSLEALVADPSLGRALLSTPDLKHFLAPLSCDLSFARLLSHLLALGLTNEVAAVLCGVVGCRQGALKTALDIKPSGEEEQNGK